MNINGSECSSVRELLRAASLTGAEIGRSMGLSKWEVNRRLRFEVPWSARDVWRLHQALKSRRVRHKLLPLLALCARRS